MLPLELYKYLSSVGVIINLILIISSNVVNLILCLLFVMSNDSNILKL